MRLTRLVMIGAVLLCLAGMPIDAQPGDEARNLVVVVEGKIHGETVFGAGIIFGVASNRLYIATARHVVPASPDEVQDLRVGLRPMPGEPLDGRLLTHFDRDLDLAVLTVPGVAEHSVPLELLRLEETQVERARPGNPVFTVGHPGADRWRVSLEPDLVSGIKGSRILFESDHLAGGHSGGGLFSARGALLGMLLSDRPPDGEAVDLQTVLETLERWGYPVTLGTGKEIVVSGAWTAEVKYYHRAPPSRESFEFEVEDGELYGTASFLVIHDGKIEGDRISFVTQEEVIREEVDWSRPFGKIIHRLGTDSRYYRGRIEGNRIRFRMVSEGPVNRRPVEFTATRPGYLGVESETLDEADAEALGLGKVGAARVSLVAPGSAASEAGFKAGDIILRVGAERIGSHDELADVIPSHEPGSELEVEILRGGESLVLRPVLTERRGETAPE